MPETFSHDVFLSHSAKDRAVARELAERLKKDGLRVWFEESAEIEEGLERSRVLVLCLSAHALGPEWPRLEAGTFRFRDPLSPERRFIPLRLDDAPVPASLAQFLSIYWREYEKLLEACQPPKTGLTQEQQAAREQLASNVLSVGHGSIHSVAFSPDGKRALIGCEDHTVQVLEVESGRCLRAFKGHSDTVSCVAWSPNGSRALSGSYDRTVRLWDVASGLCLRVFRNHRRIVLSVAWSPDGSRALSGSLDRTFRLWDIESGICLLVFSEHTQKVLSMAGSPDNSRALYGCEDGPAWIWEIKSGRFLRSFEGHSDDVLSVAWSPDSKRALSGSADTTVRLWDIEDGRCLRVLEGHSSSVLSVAWSPDGRRALSGAENGVMRVRNVTDLESPSREEAQVQYTSAKVLLVGDSGVGKTGLARYLALGLKDEERNPSTDGAWATQMKLPHANQQEGVDREIWLWDFAGQVDYRLVHQLFMDETAAAVLVFNPQNENPFEGLGQWDRDLQKATRKPFAKLLAAGRIDRGGLVVSDASLRKFAGERGFRPPLHGSKRQSTPCGLQGRENPGRWEADQENRSLAALQAAMAWRLSPRASAFGHQPWAPICRPVGPRGGCDTPVPSARGPEPRRRKCRRFP